MKLFTSKVRAMRLVVAGGAAVILYLVFAGDLSAHEVAIALALGSLGLVRAWIVGRATSRRFAFGLADVGSFLRTVARVPAATLATTGVFASVIVHGESVASSRRIAFRAGAHKNPRQRARRALALLGASLAPDGFVLRAKSNRDEVLTHEIAAPRRLNAEHLS